MVRLSARPGYESGLCIVLVMMVWFNSFQPSWAVSLKTSKKLPEVKFNRNFSGVYFDSMDFIVNNGLAISLDESGLTHLLRKIYTRFNRILVNVNIPQKTVGNFSNDQLPEAAAKLNLLLNADRPSPSPHIKLAILVSVDDWGNAETILSRFREIREVINNSNSIFPETVTTVTLEMTNLTSEACDVYLEFRKFFLESATVGVKVNLKTVMDAISANESPILGKFKTDVIQDQSLGILYVTENIDDLAGRVAVPVAIEILGAQFYRCKRLLEGSNGVTEMALITTWPDIDEKGVTKYAEFVEFWDRFSEWAVESKTSTIFLQAFDTPFATGTLTMKTNGWWQLIPDSSYLHPSQFMFKEKISLIDWKPRETDITWLRLPAEFNRPLVGVQFDPSALKSRIAKPALDTEASLHPLIQQISTKFSKIFISTSHSNKDPNSIFSIPGAIAKWNINGSRNSEMPMELLMTFDETTVDDVMRSAQEANDLFQGTVSQLIYVPTTFDKEKLLTGYLATVKVKDNMKTVGNGIKLELEICDDRQRFQEVMDLLRHDFFGDLRMNVLYFSGVVQIESSKLGVERFRPLLTVKFENCRKRVNEYFATGKGHSGMDVGFITGWNLKEEEKLGDLVEFISFWEGINNWAGRTNTPVILDSAFDSLKSGLTDGKSEAKDGWWSVKVNSTTGTFETSEDKKQAAFRIATEKLGMNESSQLTTIVAISVTGLVIVIVALLTVFTYLKKRQSAVLTNEEIALFFNGGDSNAYTGSPENMNGPYQKLHLELPKSSFTIDETSPLGSGAYGMVCRGMIRQNGGEENVAVKMTKVPSAGFALRGLLFEIKILSYLGKHPNIVGMVGAYTAELRKGRVLVFLELCEEGSLQGYLRKWKTPKMEIGVANEAEGLEAVDDPPDSEDEITELDASLVNDMGRWSFEIASGMEFIASKHIVHLDIATRNVLLTSEKQAKITDFGLSRRMYDYQSYIKKHQEPLPWRSMAPESLKRSEFTEKSDVWAFGILLWEIYTLGDEPYPGLSWDVNFPTKLERGLRPGEPTHSQDGVYSIMLHCWSTIPERRPTFAELVSGFQKLRAVVPSGSKVKDEAPGHCKEDVSETSSPTTWSGVEGKPEGVNCNGYPEPMSSTFETTWHGFGWMMWSALAIVLVIIITLFSIWSFWATGYLGTSTSGIVKQPVPPPLEIGWNITGNKLSKQVAQNKSGMAPFGEAMFVDGRNRTSLGHKLFLAIQGNWDKEEAVKALVQRGADVNVKNDLGETPLISAANCSNDKSVCLKIIEFLIENGADFEARDAKGSTFLHKLALDATETAGPAQFHQITVYLISRNMSKLFTTEAHVYTTTSLPLTPLELALRAFDIENRTLSLLSKNEVNFSTSNSFLCSAIKGRRSLQLVVFLRELGAKCLSNGYEKRGVLHVAANECFVEGVKYFLNAGLEVNGLSSPSGYTPLHYALSCEKGNLSETVRVLIERGANVSIRDAGRRTPLMVAIRANDLPDKDKVVQLLRDSRLASGNPDKVTPDELGHRLFNAIVQEYEDSLKGLVEAGANVNVRNDQYETPLITAGRCGGRDNISNACVRIIKYFIENSADVHAKDELDNTFLHHLVYFKSHPLSTSQFHEIALYLANKNLTHIFNIYGGVNHLPPIMNALNRIDVGIDTLDLLHENGVNFKGVKDGWGHSILDRALQNMQNGTHNRAEVFFKLVELGADYRGTSIYNNYTSLHAAAGYGKVEELKFLVEKGLNVNAQDAFGWTPLHYAVVPENPSNMLDVLLLLLEHGANVKIKNIAGATPLALALANSVDKEVIQLLKTLD